jgi:hypothetical protein
LRSKEDDDQAMIYELRTYTAMPGRMGDLNRRFTDVTIPLFQKHGIKIVGFWTFELGGANDRLVYMLGYESLADREKKWTAFGTDPEWAEKRAESEKNGPLVHHLTAEILRPTRYSPMQ